MKNCSISLSETAQKRTTEGHTVKDQKENILDAKVYTYKKKYLVISQHNQTGIGRHLCHQNREPCNQAELASL